MSANRLLLKYVSRYPVLVIANIILGFSGALFNGVSTALVVPLLLGFLGEDNLNLKNAPPILQKPLDFIGQAGGENQLLVMTGLVILAIILKNLTGYISSLVSSYLSRSLTNSICLEGIQLLLSVDWDFFTKMRIGDIVNRINQEIRRTANSIRIGIRMFTVSITIFVFAWLLILISWQLTVITSILLLVVSYSNQYFVKRAKGFGKVLSDKNKAYSNAFLEVLTGMRLIKAVNNEEVEYQRLERLIKEKEEAELKSQANFAALGPINEVAGIVAILGIVVTGRALFLKQMESLSSEQLQSLSAVLLTYLLVLFRLLPFVSQLNSARSEFANNSPSAEIVADFVRRDNKPFMSQGTNMYQPLTQGIEFRDVSFQYPGSQDLVLQGIDLWVPKGTTLALVGSSGAGKSTLADLVPRFYDPTQGSIRLDGKDLRSLDIGSLRRSLGIVSQDTFLFNTSVRDNLAYGLKDVTEEEIIQAAKRANAYEFIVQLPKGFDTHIGDRGVLLSGGQRQRLAIARALLRNPDILILDEATSALDTVSERLVQQAVEELCRDRTTIVIAHRLSTIQKADQIAVMSQGQVMEVGSHEELLNKGGYYSRLYSMQYDESTQNLINAAVNEALVKTSYEVRTRLNPMIGFLNLVVDDLVDSPEESRELTEEAYRSAIRLLKTLEFLEEHSREQNRTEEVSSEAIN